MRRAESRHILAELRNIGDILYTFLNQHVEFFQLLAAYRGLYLREAEIMSHHVHDVCYSFVLHDRLRVISNKLKPFGEIVVGWRKNVIEIRWPETRDLPTVFADVRTTKGPHYIHMHGYAQAGDFLARIKNAFTPFIPRATS